jgi:hypothetical protein
MSRSEWKNLGFIIKKMPPRTKIVNDIRERECKDQVKQAKLDSVARLDISKTYC